MTRGTKVLVLGLGHLTHLVKRHYFVKNLLLYPQAKTRQCKFIEMMTKEGSTYIVNVMTPGAGVLVLGRG